MRTIFTLCIALTLMMSSCGSTSSNGEPTKPEQTEVWTPKPLKVAINGQTNIPSDAIILFDGSNLDSWKSKSGSGTPQWIINPDGSMTVEGQNG